MFGTYWIFKQNPRVPLLLVFHLSLEIFTFSIFADKFGLYNTTCNGEEDVYLKKNFILKIYTSYSFISPLAILYIRLHLGKQSIKEEIATPRSL